MSGIDPALDEGLKPEVTVHDLLLSVADHIAADTSAPGLNRRFYEALADELSDPTDRGKFSYLMAVIAEKNWPRPDIVTGIGAEADLKCELDELLEGRELNWARLLYRPLRDRCHAPYSRLKALSPYSDRDIRFFANGDTTYQRVSEFGGTHMIDWLAIPEALFSVEWKTDKNGAPFPQFALVGRV